MQKWPFFNKPKVQPVQPEQKQEPAQQQKPNQQAMPNNMTMPAQQQKPNQQAMPNNMTLPAQQQKPNQQAMPNNMTMPAQQQKPNQQAMPNNMTMPAQQQKPNQQAMPNNMTMPLPTVPAPKDNSMYLSPVKNIKMSPNNNDIMGQYMNKPNLMGQQHMENSNLLSEKMENHHMMGQHMKDESMVGKSMKGDTLDDQSDTQVSMTEALNLIKEAVEGEREDRMFYDFLINNAPSNKDREIIKGIRDDEIKHAKLFRQLYYDHTGQVISPKQQVEFERPSTYCEGLIRALMGEQNAVKKYRKILFAMKDRSHINILTEIITDEIRHASLYNLLIHNNDCKY